MSGKLCVKRLISEAVLPVRGSVHAAGFDLAAASPVTVPAGGKAIVKTGLSIAIPEGTYARLAPRSGLAAKHMINVGAGVVDYDYRGEVGVVLFNHGTQDFGVATGDRVAQLILERVCMVDCVEVEALEETSRGAGGFGSTGVSQAAPAKAPGTQAATGDIPLLRVQKLRPDAAPPVRGSACAAGFDLSAVEAATVKAGGKAVVKTGLRIAIPWGTYARIAPRSGLAAKKMIHAGAGVVDYGYRGEVGVVLFNHGPEDFEVAPGDRIAQLILEEISMAPCEEVEALDDTARGAGGFGSTGVEATPSKRLRAEVVATPAIGAAPADREVPRLQEEVAALRAQLDALAKSAAVAR